VLVAHTRGYIPQWHDGEYTEIECSLCQPNHQTAGAVYANSRNHNEDNEDNEDNEVDGDKTAVFFNHTVATTNVEPTHVPVNDGTRNSF